MTKEFINMQIRTNGFSVEHWQDMCDYFSKLNDEKEANKCHMLVKHYEELNKYLLKHPVMQMDGCTCKNIGQAENCDNNCGHSDEPETSDLVMQEGKEENLNYPHPSTPVGTLPHGSNLSPRSAPPNDSGAHSMNIL